MQTLEVLNSIPFVITASVIIAAILTGIGILICKKVKKKTVGLTVYVFVLVFGLRFFVNFCGVIETDDGLQTLGLSGWEKVIDSIIHTLQTFSMDEDYTAYLLEGKNILEQMGLYNWVGVYGFISSLSNVLAPILGGALILDLLTTVFPRLRIWVHPFRHKFVFSKLNEMSICLAEDIVKEKNYKKILGSKNYIGVPLIIFTDAYIDDESEISSELLSRAKAINAVCVKANLTDLVLSHSKSVYYLLMDTDVSNSISSFSVLMKNTHLRPRFKKDNTADDNTDIPDPPAHVYLFVHDDYQAEIANKIYKSDKDASQVVLRVIRDYKNEAINLMSEVPLFMPLLLENSDRKDLYITIFGGGNIASEVFKAVYWCGQIPDIKLHVTVLTNNDQEFKDEISLSCPELFETCRKDSPLLQVFPEDPTKDFNPPYIHELKIKYVRDVRDLKSLPENLLNKTDYYVIALGSDELSVEMTKILNMEISRLKLTNNCPRGNIIIPAVFNREIAEAIAVRGVENKLNLDLDTFIIPFCMLDDRFSCKNVFMVNYLESADQTAQIYNRSHQIDMQKDEYSYWANIARTIHAPYKLFGFGFLKLKYRGFSSEQKDMFEVKNKDIACKNLFLSGIGQDKPAWIEHRRWVAFMRTQGFRNPSKDEFYAYFKETKKHKNIELKLHPCLVESSVDIVQLPESSEEFKKEKYDHLDLVAIMVHQAEMGENQKDYFGEKLRSAEYKQWDRAVNDSELKRLLDYDPQNDQNISSQ